MDVKSRLMKKEIFDFCQSIEKEFDTISLERKEELIVLRDYISKKILAKETPKLIVICTHNSRRSHLGQLWLSVGADYYNLPEIQTFSGGTEATAFNPRAVNAIQSIGFQVTTLYKEATNPVYNVSWKTEMSPYSAFSKKYDGAPNPREAFGAIMVCNSADQGCPIVSGCDFRLALPYNDPKEFDDTPLETAKYAERCRDIGREMLFVLSGVKTP